MNSNGKGFTLIELALVLMLVGLLISLGVGMLGPLTRQAKYSDSRDVVKAAKAALLGYTVKNGFAPSSAGDPFGAAGARKLDAWGRNLVYGAANTLNGSGSACGVTATNITVFECTNDTCSTDNKKNNIVFIAYSLGDDADGTGTTTAPSGFTDTCPLGNTCYYIRQPASTYTVGATTYQYDDIVQYATLDEVRADIGCSFNITTKSFPDARTGVAYSMTLQASGGQTPYTSWSTGQAQGACAAGNVRLVAADIGLCLNTATGVVSGTPNNSGIGVNNFTVTLTDKNGITTSSAFTLNVVDSCAVEGINIVNNTGGNVWFKRNGSGCTGPWAGGNLNAQTGASGGVQPNDTYSFYTNGGCSAACGGATNLTYSQAQSTDSTDLNCQIQFTGACVRSDL